jgi:hypothetical protein
LTSNAASVPPDLYEQAYPQQDGYALLMLWLEKDDEDDSEVDDDRTSEQRLQDRQARRR